MRGDRVEEKNIPVGKTTYIQCEKAQVMTGPPHGLPWAPDALQDSRDWG